MVMLLMFRVGMMIRTENQEWSRRSGSIATVELEFL